MNNKHRPMRIVWQSLLWKEWHEHKWKLASLTAILLVALLAIYFSASGFYTSEGTIGTLVCFCILAGMFLGMSTAGGESGRKTLPFLQALPVPMWQPAAMKLMVAMLTVVLPVLIFSGVSCIWWTFRTSSGGLTWDGQSINSADWIAIALLASLGVSSLVLWIAAAGVNRSDEIQAGAKGFLVVVFIWGVLGVSIHQAESQNLTSVQQGIEVLFAAAPGGPAIFGVDNPNRAHDSFVTLPLILSAIIGHGCVLAWYLRRFGRVVAGPARAAGKASSFAKSLNYTLGPPRRSQLTAIAWKQFWETGPLAAMAAMLILVIVTAVYLYNFDRMSIKEYGETLAAITLSVAFLVTVVTGIGVFFEDLKPGVDDFWRSRPINLPLWFGIKYMVGLTVLVTTFGTLLLLAGGLSGPHFFDNADDPLSIVGTISCVFLLIYTLSMAFYCILRQPIYAAILGVGLPVGGFMLLEWVAKQFNPAIQVHWAVGLFFLLFLQVIVTTVAWLAVRHNWRLKSPV